MWVGGWIWMIRCGYMYMRIEDCVGVDIMLLNSP